MNVIGRLRSTEVSARAAAICIVVLLLVSIAVITVAKNVASGPQPSVSREEDRSVANKNARVIVKELDKSSGKDKSMAVEDGKKPAEVSDPYSIIVERDLFKPLPGQAGDPSGNPSPGEMSVPPMPVAMPPRVICFN